MNKIKKKRMNSFLEYKIYLGLILIIIQITNAEISSDNDSSTKTEPGFVLVAPSRYIAGNTAHFCLYLPPHPEDEFVYKKMKLELNPIDAEQSSYVTKTFQIYNLGCFDFAIPLSSDILKLGAVPERARLTLYLEQEDANILLSREVWIIGDPYETVVQTDRAVYKPGDLIRIRALSFTYDFLSINEPFSLIWIENPVGIRIAQWRNVSTQRGLAELNFPLSYESMQGVWKLFTKRSIHERSASFRVEEYILPRFEVDLNAPEYLLHPNLSGSWKICAKYTFGKPVQGMAYLKVEHNKYSWISQGMANEKYETNEKLINGCATIEVNLKDYINLTYIYYDLLESRAYVIEENTNVQINSSESKKSQVTDQSYKFEIEKYSSNHYQIGLLYTGELVATKINGEHAIEKQIQLCVKKYEENVFYENVVGCKNFTTNKQGKFKFTIAPPINSTSITLVASEVSDIPETKPILNNQFLNNKIITYHSIRPWYSPSGSYIRSIEPKHITQSISCGKRHSFVFEFTNPDKMEKIDFIYLVQAKGEIIETGQISSSIASSLSQPVVDKSFIGNLSDLVASSQISIDIPITAKHSPQASILLYYIRPDLEIVASDAYNFMISSCLEDKVNAWWVNRNRIPGSNALLRVSTPIPNSLCSLSVIDKASELLKTSNDKAQTRIDRNHIANVFQRLEDPIIYSKDDREYCQKQLGDDNFFGDSSYSDASQSFLDFHSTLFTNLIYETRPCYKRIHWYQEEFDMDSDNIQPRMLAQPLAAVSAMGRESKGFSPSAESNMEGTTIRTFFTETWLWENFNTGPDGSAQLEKPLPHSITQWVGHLFCLSPSGSLAVAPPFDLVTFQPFFLEYLTPYAIKRNEIVYLKTIIFNFLDHSLPVRLEYWGATGLELLSNSSIQFCLPPGQNYVHNFKVRAFDIGELNTTVSVEIDDSYPEQCGPQVLMYKRDVLVKPILVKPEGFPVEEDYSKLACPSENSEDSVIRFQITLKNDVIVDSARAGIAISADIMGPTLMNLDKLIRLPTGCGEQNMILLAPNIQVLHYLENIRKINPYLKNRAINFIKKGYQRQQNYKHLDGSYSAFGPKNDESGSIWLTAFVVKTFSQARRYTFIDRKHLEQSLKWIISQQMQNGCFPKIGHVFHSNLKGGLSDSNSALTSYILIALLDTDYELNRNVIDNALRCLTSSNDEDDLYALVLKTYAFALAKENDLVDQNMEILMDNALRENNLIYWESQGNLAISIEMTAYIALIKMQQNTQNNGELISIIRWINLQRNANGGFQSTQDTVIGLEAISKFASRLFTDKNKDMIITINSEDLNEMVNITSYNRQLVHQFNVPVIPSEITVSIQGTDCLLIQMWNRYNTRLTEGEALFNVHTSLKASDISPNSKNCDKVGIIICMKFKPIGKETNMALLEVEMVSGYSPDKYSIAELTKKNKDIKRWEFVRDQLIFYFDNIGNEEKCIEFDMDQTSVVENPLEASIHIYDYYNREISYKKSYTIRPDDCIFINNTNNKPSGEIRRILEEENIFLELRKNNETRLEGNLTKLVDLSSIFTSTTSEMPLVFNLNLNSTFINVDHELEFPKSLEGPHPNIVHPDGSPINPKEEEITRKLLQNDVECPECWNKLPIDLPNTYCDADIVFKMIIDSSNKGRIVYHIKPPPAEDRNETSRSISFVLNSECTCEPLSKVNRHVVVFAKGDEFKKQYYSSNQMLNLTLDKNIALSTIIKRKAMKKILSINIDNCEKESLRILNPVNLYEE